MILKTHVSILCINILILRSLGSLRFESNKRNNIKIFKYLFKENFFHFVNYQLTIFPLNFDDKNPKAFTALMKILYRHSSVVVVDNLTEAKTMSGQNYLVLQSGEEIEYLLETLEFIGMKMEFTFKRILIWYEGITSEKIKSLIEKKISVINVDEVILLYSIFINNKLTGKQVNCMGSTLHFLLILFKFR